MKEGRFGRISYGRNSFGEKLFWGGEVEEVDDGGMHS